MDSNTKKRGEEDKMRRALKSRKGVSPLIATVLLIAFAVALGAVVMNWGRTYVEETADYAKSKSDTDVACSMDVKIKAVEIGGIPQICYNNSFDSGATGYVKFMVRNTGNKVISGLQVEIVGESGIYSNASILNSSILRAQIIKRNLTYEIANYGNFSQIIITPKISIKGVDVPCADMSLTKEASELTECSS